MQPRVLTLTKTNDVATLFGQQGVEYAPWKTRRRRWRHSSLSWSTIHNIAFVLITKSALALLPLKKKKKKSAGIVKSRNSEAQKSWGPEVLTAAAVLLAKEREFPVRGSWGKLTSDKQLETMPHAATSEGVENGLGRGARGFLANELTCAKHTTIASKQLKYTHGYGHTKHYKGKKIKYRIWIRIRNRRSKWDKDFQVGLANSWYNCSLRPKQMSHRITSWI